ncbi:hypothetical protein V1511DRAFT_502120 [Dipodascopsis uninucleata]
MAATSLVAQNHGGSSDLTIGLHPLALLNISDYFTRAHLSRSMMVGGLIGRQDGRDVSIEQAFEFKLTDGGTIDENLFSTKLEQYKAVFPDLYFIGWFHIPLAPPYEPTEDILGLHEFLARFHNDTPPLLMILNARLALESTGELSRLPITIYETVIVENGQPQFVEVMHRIESSEAEHIGILYVAKQDSVDSAEGDVTKSLDPGKSVTERRDTQDELEPTSVKAIGKGKAISREPLIMSPVVGALAATASAGASTEEIVSQLTSQTNAVRMLLSRLQLLQSYLSYVRSKPADELTAADFEILRLVSGLIGRLGADTVSDDTINVQVDALLVGILGLVTNGMKIGKDMNKKRQTLDMQFGMGGRMV